ncbi:MAG TPA: hypothetical protein VIK86_02040 [Candidatus Paceibacterota bacterium]
MCKCAKCGTYIKNIYYLDGKKYGSECYKNLVTESYKIKSEKLEIIRKINIEKKQELKQLQELEELRKNKSQSIAIIEMLKIKNMKRVKNEYKLKMYDTILKEYEELGSLDNYLISKALDLFLTTDKDRLTFYLMWFEISEGEEKVEAGEYLFDCCKYILDIKNPEDLNLLITAVKTAGYKTLFTYDGDDIRASKNILNKDDTQILWRLEA